MAGKSGATAEEAGPDGVAVASAVFSTVDAVIPSVGGVYVVWLNSE